MPGVDQLADTAERAGWTTDFFRQEAMNRIPKAAPTPAPRLDVSPAALEQTQQSLPLIYKILQRFTQDAFKLIRWLRAHWHQPTSLPQALLHLRALYATL